MTENYKQMAGEYAAEHFVESGMTVGLGHGSTAIWATRWIAHALKDGALTGVKGIPASKTVEREATELGVPLISLDECPVIDVTIDGADEADPNLNLIKGGGGALLVEKIIAQASKREVIIADYTKISDCIGTKWAVPIEVIPTGWRNHQAFLAEMGGEGGLRLLDSGEPFRTDHGNYIIDWRFGVLTDPYSIAAELKTRAGIVEHGMFLGLANDLIIAGPEGIKHLTRS